MSKDPFKWMVWIVYIMGLFNLITWLAALNAPIWAWGGLATVMLGSGALNALGYPFGPKMLQKGRRELWEAART